MLWTQETQPSDSTKKLQKIYNVHLRNEPGVWYGVIPLVGIQPDHKKTLLLHSIAAPIQS